MERFTIPDDPVALRMENDLLRFENEHLRGVLHGSDVAYGTGAAEADVLALEERLAAATTTIDELARARSDLRWLLLRLEGTPARVLLRRFGGYRTLVARWLES